MNNIEIDFYKGTNNNVVLIITCIGGSTKGFQNKYETMATNIINIYGHSVFVATTPHGSWNNPDKNIDYIINHIHSKISKINPHYKIYVLSVSAGATFMLWHAYKFAKITRVVAINPVINVNFHLIQNGMLNFKGEFVKVIVGELDHSFKLYALLNKVKNIEKVSLPNIDHNFTNKLDVFLEIPNKYLL